MQKHYPKWQRKIFNCHVRNLGIPKLPIIIAFSQWYFNISKDITIKLRNEKLNLYIYRFCVCKISDEKINYNFPPLEINVNKGNWGTRLPKRILKEFMTLLSQ